VGVGERGGELQQSRLSTRSVWVREIVQERVWVREIVQERVERDVTPSDVVCLVCVGALRKRHPSLWACLIHMCEREQGVSFILLAAIFWETECFRRNGHVACLIYM